MLGRVDFGRLVGRDSEFPEQLKGAHNSISGRFQIGEAPRRTS